MSDTQEIKTDEVRKFHIEEYKILFENYHKKNHDIRNITQFGITGISVTYGWLLTKNSGVTFFGSMVWLIPIVISYVALQYSVGLRRTMDVDRDYLKKIETFFAGRSVALEGRENFFDQSTEPRGAVFSGMKLGSREFKVWTGLLWISIVAFTLRIIHFLSVRFDVVPEYIKRIIVDLIR